MQDLAPFALYHSYWEQGITPAPLPVVMGSWQQALPGSDLDSEQSKSLSGFVGPSMCQQVFQSTAANDSPMQATQRAQRHLAAGTSMRGSGSIALPPVQEVGYEQVSDTGFNRSCVCFGLASIASTRHYCMQTRLLIILAVTEALCSSL